MVLLERRLLQSCQLAWKWIRSFSGAFLPSHTDDQILTIFCSNVTQSDNSVAFLARHVGHLSGLKKTVPALGVNR